MHASSLAVESSEQAVEVSALISFDRADRSPFRLWFRLPEANKGLIALSGDHLAAALYFPTMTLGENLTIDLPVSKALKSNLRRVASLVSTWPRENSWRVAFHAVKVQAPDGGADRRGAPGVGCFFTLGVDSFFTLIHKSDVITHLIFVEGYDVPLAQTRLLAETHEHLAAVARASGKSLVVVSTNLRELTESCVEWESYHGAALAAVGLLLGGGLGRIYFSSSDAYQTLASYGTHPYLDPLWSNDRVRFSSYGYPYNRAEKIRRTACNRLMQQHLRVCWENGDGQGDYNCSNCMKCLRTMLQIQATGYLPHYETFKPPLPFHVLDTAVEPPHRFFIWDDLLQTIPAGDEVPGTRDRIVAMLKRSREAAAKNVLREDTVTGEMSPRSTTRRLESLTGDEPDGGIDFYRRRARYARSLIAFLREQNDLYLLTDMRRCIGERLILAGTQDLLDSGEIKHRCVTLAELGDGPSLRGTLLFPGSSAFCEPWQEWLPEAIDLASRRFHTVIVLPSSYRTDVPAVGQCLARSNVYLFAREARSFAAIKHCGRAALQLDCAAYYHGFEERPMGSNGACESGKSLVAFRTDEGSSFNGLPFTPDPDSNEDISVTRHTLENWIDAIDRAESVVTDRLQVACCAVLLGKRLAYVDPHYEKLSAYFAFAFRESFASAIRRRSTQWLVEHGYLRRDAGFA